MLEAAAHDASARGRYELGELLGRGGMAEVFAGCSLGAHGFSKPVAIKRLLPEIANDHVFVDRLIGEAKLLVNIQHGNIVSVIDLVREGSDVFLVMEYIDGPSLQRLVKVHRKLPLSVATYIIQSAAAGLEFAHARPTGAVIHADISPSNILLTNAGEVRVADFGIARREGVSGIGGVEGKWAYMAPEQARGEGLTPASDVFSLGVVLYELITGRHPLQAGQDSHRPSGYVVPPNTLDPAIPPALALVCMHAIAPDPRDRFRRMQDLIDELVNQRFANGWREGASDLARLIRDVSGPDRREHTLLTQRPVTLMTRSLIVAAPPLPRITSEPTNVVVPADLLASSSHAMPAPRVPYTLAGVVPPMPVSARPAAAPAPVSSFHGSQTVTATESSRHGRRPLWQFILAAAIGVTLALVIAGIDDDEPAASTPQTERVAAETKLADPAPLAEPAPAPSPPVIPPAPDPASDPIASSKQAANVPVASSKPAPVAIASSKPAAHEPVASSKQAADVEASEDKQSTKTSRTSKPSRVKTTPRVEPKSRSQTDEPKSRSQADPKPAPPAVPSPTDAVLRIRTIPEVEAKVTIDNKDTTIHGQLPGGKFTLTAGRYHVLLSNSRLGVWVDCGRKSIQAGKVTVLVADVKAGTCKIEP